MERGEEIRRDKEKRLEMLMTIKWMEDEMELRSEGDGRRGESM